MHVKCRHVLHSFLVNSFLISRTSSPVNSAKSEFFIVLRQNSVFCCCPTTICICLLIQLLTYQHLAMEPAPTRYYSERYQSLNAYCPKMTRHTIKSCNIFVVSFKVWVVVIFSGINVFFLWHINRKGLRGLLERAKKQRVHKGFIRYLKPFELSAEHYYEIAKSLNNAKILEKETFEHNQLI